jgi:hypothetical protein
MLDDCQLCGGGGLEEEWLNLRNFRHLRAYEGT